MLGCSEALVLVQGICRALRVFEVHWFGIRGGFEVVENNTITCGNIGTSCLNIGRLPQPTTHSPTHSQN